MKPVTTALVESQVVSGVKLYKLIVCAAAPPDVAIETATRLTRTRHVLHEFTTIRRMGISCGGGKARTKPGGAPGIKWCNGIRLSLSPAVFIQLSGKFIVIVSIS
jgi:hypothetical protein